MPKTKSSHRKAREAAKPGAPPIDGLTVAWMVTLSTALLCQLAAAATRIYFRFIAPQATLLGTLSGLLLFSAAVIGLFLLVMTPIVVARKKSNPPRGVIFFAYVVGAAPWLAMVLQIWE